MPGLIINSTIARRNISRMAAKAKAGQVTFRPHFKTHQSTSIGEWFRGTGVSVITVSSVDMARHFAAAGWDDITIAIPAPLNELPVIDDLAGKIQLHLLVDSPEAVLGLARRLHNPVQVWIKIDVGYHRCGMLWYDTENIIDLARQIDQNRNLHFQGILTHAGHTYHQPDRAAVLDTHNSSVQRLIELQQEMQAAGLETKISIGDTPGCTVANDFRGIDEIRPGNFIFYDLMQLQLGVCQPEDIAVAVRCPVIGIYPKRGEIAVHCGAVHLSKEGLKTGDGSIIFGCLATPSPDGWTSAVWEAPVINLSQEHGIVRCSADQMNDIAIGDYVTILPVHSCLTVNNYPSYVTTDGQTIPKFQSIG